MTSSQNIPATVEIAPFKVQSGQYTAPMLRMFFGRNWWWLAVPVTATLALSLWLGDVRWLIVSLMLVFMVTPMILSLIYFYYALTLEVRWSLMEKSIVIDGEGLHLYFTDRRMQHRHIPWSEITSVTRDRKAFYFNLRVRRYNFVMIPCEVLAAQGITEQQFTLFIKANFPQQHSNAAAMR